MNKFLAIVIIAIIFPFLLYYQQIFAQEDTEILIASWNIQQFGKTRASSDENLAFVADIMTGSLHENLGKDFDLIFVQEIQSSGMALEKLCVDYMEELDYTCEWTEQFGRDANNEAYGVIYKNYVNVTVEDTSLEGVDPGIVQGKERDKGQMIRPPMKATVTIGDFQFYVYNNHIKPDRTLTLMELDNLEDAINDHHGMPTDDKIIILGDLNAACDFLDEGIESYENLFDEPEWNNIFSDDDITNFTPDGDCAYDKIIVNSAMNQFFTGEYNTIDTDPISGERFGSTLDPPFKVDEQRISDHQLIWAEFDVDITPGFFEDSFIELISPHEQIKMDISPSEVTCNENLTLVLKSTDGSPACVKPESVTKLVERGWAKS